MSVEINQTNNLDPNLTQEQASQEQIKQQLLELAKDPSINKPSEDEVKQFGEEYEAAAVSFENSRWSIGIPEEGQMILDFIRHYSRERHMWKGNEWMGVIKMQEELDLVEKEFATKGGNEPANFEYKAVEFIFHMLQNPGGIGYQSALDFEGEIETYAKVFDIIGKTIAEGRAALQDLDFLQQKWQAAAQGFYLEKEDGVVKEEGEVELDPNEGAYYDEKLKRDVIPGEPEYNIEVFQTLMQEKYAKELADQQETEKETEKTAE